MKVWIEFPEETRFAKQPRDVLYTPIYFANEKISAHLRLDNEWRTIHGEELDRLFIGRAKLVAKASLGFLSIGGKPVNSADARYDIPNLGFKPIYTLEILNSHRRVTLANLEYDVNDGVRGGRTPFSFTLPASTLEELQQLASSLKVITADNISTMDFLKGVTPALIVSVQYTMVVEILDENAQVKASCSEEIRVFVSLSEEQVPTSSEPAIASNPMAKFTGTQVVSFNSNRSRRDSIPLIRRLSRSVSTQDTNLVTINVESIEPFTFTRQSDAAASKVVMSLMYSTDASLSDVPPKIYGNIQWMLKSLSTLTLEPLDRGESSEQAPDDYFHLRAKLLPSRKLSLCWSTWDRLTGRDPSRTQWKSVQTIWLVKDLSSGMTPTFTTPYLTHSYMLNLAISLVENETKLNRSLVFSGKQKVEMDVPVQVRYELGLVPSYEVDQSLPEYDHTLPEYEESEARADEETPTNDEAGGAETDPALPDLEDLNLNLAATRDEDGVIPIRRRPQSPEEAGSSR